MRYAILDAAGVVTNIIEASPSIAATVFTSAVPLSEPGGLGSVWSGTNFSTAPSPSNAPPPQVELYRIKVLMALTASTHGGTLEARATAYIATLADPQKTIADRLWNGPTPYLEVNGSFAQGFKAWEGLSDDQWSALIQSAITLSL